MNEPAIIFQYLLDNIPQEYPVGLHLGPYRIDLSDNHSLLKVTKKLSGKSFKVSDPNCAEEIVKFLDVVEDRPIEVDFNDWFRVIGEQDLRKGALKATELLALIPTAPTKLTHDSCKKERGELRSIYRDLVNKSWPNPHVYEDCGYFLDGSLLCWRDFIEELKYDGVLNGA